MEQFFIVLAILAVWVFRGVAGASRRNPGESGDADGALGPAGTMDVTATTRQRSLEAQQRAIEALQRWEAKQGLGSRDPQEREVPTPAPREFAAGRTRTARPAQFSRRTTAERKRREAYAEISRMLDPAPSDRRSSERRGFEVPRTADPAPEVARAQPRVVSLEDPAELEALAARRERSSSSEAAPRGSDPGDRPQVTRLGKPKRGAERGRGTARAGLPRLEGLPLAARAMVYAELLGPPRSLR